MTLRVALSFVALQAGWFACVVGAAHHHPWFGPLVVVAALAGHLRAQAPRLRAPETLVLALAASIGLAVDTALLRSGIITIGGAGVSPPWLVVLWPNLAAATATSGSLGSLARRPWLGAVVGAIAGPLAYESGCRLGAIGLGPDRVHALVVIGLAWSGVLPTLSWLRSITTRCRARQAHQTQSDAI